MTKNSKVSKDVARMSQELATTLQSMLSMLTRLDEQLVTLGVDLGDYLADRYFHLAQTMCKTILLADGQARDPEIQYYNLLFPHEATCQLTLEAQRVEWERALPDFQGLDAVSVVRDGYQVFRQLEEIGLGAGLGQQLLEPLLVIAEWMMRVDGEVDDAEQAMLEAFAAAIDCPVPGGPPSAHPAIARLEQSGPFLLQLTEKTSGLAAALDTSSADFMLVSVVRLLLGNQQMLLRRVSQFVQTGSSLSDEDLDEVTRTMRTLFRDDGVWSAEAMGRVATTTGNRAAVNDVKKTVQKLQQIWF